MKWNQSKAHWINVKAVHEEGWSSLYQCSECGGRVEADFTHEPDYNFCPYCGRKILTRTELAEALNRNHGCQPGGAE